MEYCRRSDGQVDGVDTYRKFVYVKAREGGNIVQISVSRPQGQSKFSETLVNMVENKMT